MDRLWRKYLANAININREWRLCRGIKDGTCWDAIEAVEAIFTQTESIDPTSFIIYYFESSKKVHFALNFRNRFYQIEDNGIVYLSRVVFEKDLLADVNKVRLEDNDDFQLISKKILCVERSV